VIKKGRQLARETLLAELPVSSDRIISFAQRSLRKTVNLPGGALSNSEAEINAFI
jgi:hypothetical protein